MSTPFFRTCAVAIAAGLLIVPAYFGSREPVLPPDAAAPSEEIHCEMRWRLGWTSRTILCCWPGISGSGEIVNLKRLASSAASAAGSTAGREAK